ncbi:MAG TPA: RDD family protein [Ignavibacteria bacterium]|nr:RDD family protein [Ignavibacteria bacterium]HMQ98453.1 RDD family protein [Ignavibacteria bacterium]
MNFPKIIPLWLFRTIGISMLTVCLLVSFYFIVTFSGPFEFFAELLTDDSGTYLVVLAALLTLLLLLMPCLVVALVLRPFSNVPSFKSQMTDMGPFTTKFKSVVDTSVYGELPSVLSRCLAFIIDRVIVIIFIAVPAAVFTAVMEQTGRTGAIYYILLVFMIGFILIGAVYSYARDMFGGKSIARRLLKQKVVDISTGKPIGGWRSFKREIIIHFAPLILVELILISSNRDRRRMGDNWAKTIVVKDLPS